jgi:hypothetical protein
MIKTEEVRLHLFPTLSPLLFYLSNCCCIFLSVGFLEGESTKRVEKYYLGSFSIPFHTVYHEGKIEGIFRVDTPLLNFGYERKTYHLKAPESTAGSAIPGSPTRGGVKGENILRTASQDEEMAQQAGISTDNNIDAGRGVIHNLDGTQRIPTNSFILGIQSFFTLLSICFFSMIDFCCPNLKDRFLDLMDLLLSPFNTIPLTKYYNNLYMKSSHLSPDTQVSSFTHRRCGFDL